jgi:hypothetical protein
MPPVTSRDAVSDAVTALKRAEERVAEAERARGEADDALDQALAERGWSRLRGGFTAKLYTRLGSNPVPRDDVVAHEMGVAA